MTPILVVVLLAVVLWLFTLLQKTRETTSRIEERLRYLEYQESQRTHAERAKAAATAAAAAEATKADQSGVGTEPAQAPPVAGAASAPRVPPPLPVAAILPRLVSSSAPVTASEAFAAQATEGPAPAKEFVSPSPIRPAIPARSVPSRPKIQWESFLGVKLFAWVGGLALFLGVAFFVKYSFDHNLISPTLRVAIGYVVGLGLMVGGLAIPRQRHLVTVQSLCATGTVILYAVTFAAAARYHLFEQIPAFGLMSLVTVAAFFLAVRLDGQVVAVLGLLGGFLTPWMLRTGHDNPPGLFGYLALLDLGLIAVVVRTRWNYLTLLAAVSTVFMQFGWVFTFFAESKVGVAMTVFGGFAILFVVAFFLIRRFGKMDRWILSATVVPVMAGLLFAGYLMWHPYESIAARVWLMFGFILALDLVFLVVAWMDGDAESRTILHMGGTFVFLLLMSWTAQYLKPELLEPALAGYFVFTLIHAAAPLILERRRPSPQFGNWLHVFPSLALILILVPLFSIPGPSIWVWPVIMAIDLLAIVLTVLTMSLGSLLAVFLLTSLGTAAWIFQLPTELPSANGMLTVVGGFAFFFVAAALLSARRVFGSTTGTSDAVGARAKLLYAQASSMGAVLPFLLLTLVEIRLPLVNPSSVFGLAALLVVILSWIAVKAELDLLLGVSLGAILLVEHVWHFQRYTPGMFAVATGWYLVISLFFLSFPFFFRRRLVSRVKAWIPSALALPLHFLLLYRGFTEAHPGFGYAGLVPAALALPCLAGLIVLIRDGDGRTKEGLSRLALFGGAALFFITLVIPIQFDRQWITIGWALEGCALLWLFHRVPHPGLRVVGVGLLAVSFARLALNPFVLSDYGRTGTPIWNWYLYSYGVVAACLLVGGWLLSPPRDRLRELRFPPILYSAGGVLLFLLVNIEIADFFSPAGHPLVFNFSAGFGQDMAYSLAWGVFAFGLLGIGFWQQQPGPRYTGVGMLVVTLVKLFLHDIWRLGGLYRIGALIGLAVVLILVSLIYQRFLTRETPASSDSAPSP